MASRKPQPEPEKGELAEAIRGLTAWQMRMFVTRCILRVRGLLTRPIEDGDDAFRRKVAEQFGSAIEIAEAVCRAKNDDLPVTRNDVSQGLAEYASDHISEYEYGISRPSDRELFRLSKNYIDLVGYEDFSLNPVAGAKDVVRHTLEAAARFNPDYLPGVELAIWADLGDPELLESFGEGLWPPEVESELKPDGSTELTEKRVKLKDILDAKKDKQETRSGEPTEAVQVDLGMSTLPKRLTITLEELEAQFKPFVEQFRKFAECHSIQEGEDAVERLRSILLATMPENQRRVLDIDQASALTNLSQSRMKQLYKNSNIGRKHAGRLMFSESELLGYLERNPGPGRPSSDSKINLDQGKSDLG